MRLREQNAGIAGECLTKQLQVPEFALEVEFATDDPLELGDNRDRLIRAELRQEPLGERCQLEENRDVVDDSAMSGCAF